MLVVTGVVVVVSVVLIAIAVLFTVVVVTVEVDVLFVFVSIFSLTSMARNKQFAPHRAPVRFLKPQGARYM